MRGKDAIVVNDLRAVTLVGALPHEREIPQPVRVDLVIGVDLSEAGRSDELADTVDYGLVCERVVEVVRESKDVLLERLAGRVAETVLAFDRADHVEVTLTKLRPPVPEHLGTTAVRLSRSRSDADVPPVASHRAIVALGSNLGDREHFLRAAVHALGDVVAASQVFETEPVGGPDGQGAYLNMVVELRTALDPFALLRRCQRIEADALRQRVVRWGPRTLDVDLLFYDDVRLESAELVLPHPRVGERRFVLAPLSEVAPELCPPGWEGSLPAMAVVPRGPLTP